jgi:hypothetical protein
MQRIFITLFLGLLAAPGFAQQQPPDPAVVQRALAAVQTQRNQAFDLAASWEARAVGLADDLARAQAKIKEFEAKQKPAE